MGYGNVSERRRGQPDLGVSVVILALGDAACAAPDAQAADGERSRARLWLPLVRRVKQPFAGCWALPGGGVRADESLERAAYRALESTTRLHPRYLEQLHAFSGPDRSHGGLPMVTIAHWALVGRAETHDFASDGTVRWFAEDALDSLELAFDHRRIIDHALRRLRTRIEVPSLVARLVGPTFTLRQLHDVVEAVSGQGIDLANFRRKMLASGQLEDTGRKRREGRQRPAAVYRYVAAADSWPYAWEGERLDALDPASRGTGAGEDGVADSADDALSALMPSR